MVKIKGISNLRLVLAVIIIAAFGVFAWFVGLPLVYVLALDGRESKAAPSVELIDHLPRNVRVLGTREYSPEEALGHGMRLAVIEGPDSSLTSGQKALAAYRSRGFDELDVDIVASEQGCVSTESVEEYLSHSEVDKELKSWVNDTASGLRDRSVVVIYSWC